MPNYPAPASGADKYHGAVATGYDAKREDSDKWKVEQRIIEGMMDDLPVGSAVLDVPCGTGRFFGYYQSRAFIVDGVDRSDDMLKQALTKATAAGLDRYLRLVCGDVRQLPSTLEQYDVSVMCRLTRWLSPEDCVTALCELIRVTTKRVIFTARVRNHPHARGYDLIQAALKRSADAGRHWRIARDEAGYQEDYRIIALEPIA